MFSVQARPTVETFLSGEIAPDQPAASGHLKILFASIFRQRLRTKQYIMPDYEGRSWSNSSEHHILEKIAVSQAKRALI